MSNDSGIPERGPGYEYYNFLPALDRLPLDYTQFDYAQEILDHGYWGSMARLRRLITDWQPDALMILMYQEQVDRELMRWVTESTPTTTIGWFADDHWRFDNFSKYWASAFNWVATTDFQAVEKYRAIGQPNVFLTQWAANEEIYKPSAQPLLYDVSFVGQCYGERASTVKYLSRHGIKVSPFGPGWSAGRLSQQEMIEVFGRSRINLNLAASSVAGSRVRDTRQIKGRVFEVPASGGLLLTDYAPDLERYFEIGDEVVVFDGKRDLLHQVRTLLSDEPRRAQIAEAGYRRTVHEHTWFRRFAALFEAVRLLAPAEGEVSP